MNGISSNTKLTLEILATYDSSPHHGSKETRYLCPYCGIGKPHDDAHRSMCVNKLSGAYVCHRCHVRGKIGEIHLGVPPPKLSQPDLTARQYEIAKYKKNLQNIIDLRGSYGQAYLEGRGIPFEIAQQSKVKFSMSWYAGRAVLFPMRNAENKLVAVNARFLSHKYELKHMTAGNKVEGVFACHGAWQMPATIITESPIDALSLATIGYPALASCGEGLPKWIWQHLTNEVIIAVDNDDKGIEMGERWLRTLKRNMVGYIVTAHSQKDWNDVLRMHGEECLAEEFNTALERLQ